MSLAAGLPGWNWQKGLSGAIITAAACYESKAAPCVINCKDCHSSTLTGMLYDSLWRLFHSLFKPRTEANLTKLSLPHTVLTAEQSHTHDSPLKRTESSCCQSKHLSLFAWAYLPHFHRRTHGSTWRKSKGSSKPEQRPKEGKNVWGLAWKGLGILEYFSSSTFEKLRVRDRQSLPPERVCMLSSVKDGHLKVFEVLAQGQMTSWGSILWL